MVELYQQIIVILLAKSAPYFVRSAIQYLDM